MDPHLCKCLLNTGELDLFAFPAPFALLIPVRSEGSEAVPDVPLEMGLFEAKTYIVFISDCSAPTPRFLRGPGLQSRLSLPAVTNWEPKHHQRRCPCGPAQSRLGGTLGGACRRPEDAHLCGKAALAGCGPLSWSSQMLHMDQESVLDVKCKYWPLTQ